MALKDLIGKAKRRGREPLGTGYGVHGAGGITETGGKTYQQVSDKIIKEKRKEDFKEGVTKAAKGLQKLGQKMAEAQARQEQDEPMRAPSFNKGIESMGLGLGPTEQPEKEKKKPKEKTEKKVTTIKLPSGETIEIS